MSSYFVYLLKCSDNTFYCGYTTDTSKRLKDHNSSKSKTKYTRVRRPVQLVYSEAFADKSSALKREIEIKKLTREQKLKLFSSVS